MSDPYAPPANDENPPCGSDVSGLPITSEMISQLQGARPWQTFFGIIMLLAVAGMLALALMASIVAVSAEDNYALFRIGQFVLFTIPYVLPAYFLLQATSVLRRMQRRPKVTVSDLELALRYQRAFWRYLGLSTIGTIALYLLLLTVGVVVVLVDPSALSDL